MMKYFEKNRSTPRMPLHVITLEP